MVNTIPRKREQNFQTVFQRRFCALISGFLDETISYVGSEICLIIPSNVVHQYKIGARSVVSNSTSELLVVCEALNRHLYLLTFKLTKGLVMFVILKQLCKQ